MQKHNFSAGPCVLPKPVIEKTAEAVKNLNNSNLSILEISHRSAPFVKVMQTAQNLVLELMELDSKDYSVLFLQGGASLEFLMVPYNLMPLNGTAAYLDTGTWSSKAIKETKKLGNVEIVASSKDKNYNYIPKNYQVSEKVSYFHITSNNTIFGTQIKNFPDVRVPLVCDMSSDIFSRQMDFSKFDLIYAGAQKNMGPAGTTLVVVRKSILGKTGRDIPSMLDYQVHIAKDSMFNTPAVFAVYTSMLDLQWLKDMGGISAIEKINKAKANLLYNEIDENPLFKGTAEKEDRSNMNATFVLTDESYKERFDKLCADAGIVGINGHRSVGGYRASMYNALTLESVEVLVAQMKKLNK
ncbi:MAG: 3-phosphoserine/phosphohydroxythreonine transaminase [Flavobacteriales bacterium]|nr:MAG: 3-phosphoserine/phosphohydroxythreonine transaminase [Flavobacteriales bacterium]